MSLLTEIDEYLRSRRVPFCLIGAVALGAHGVSRATHDADLFTTDARALEPGLWLEFSGPSPDIRTGDADDPLSGVVRLVGAGGETVDVIVGRPGWQSEIVGRAQVIELEGQALLVAHSADLVLLKLYAGGPQDLWDIRQLLEAVPDRDSAVQEVDARIDSLPVDARRLWQALGQEDRI